MKNDTQRLTDWVIRKIKTEYPDDVALLVAVEGASINGDGHGEPFDYFVPATEHGNELAQTFIIGGVGNDLYPRSWERMERTASLDDPCTPCLGGAKILYARTPEDEARFEALRQKLLDRLADPHFVYVKALERLEEAMRLYAAMEFEERLCRVRAQAGYAFTSLADAAAYLNGTWRKDWHHGPLAEILTWKALPDGFAELYRRMLGAKEASELRSLTHLLIASTRRFIASYRPQDEPDGRTPDYRSLAGWYEELCTWWKRLSFFCASGDAGSAFREACQLQEELDVVGEEFGLGELDLLGCFDSADLAPLAARAEALEEQLLTLLRAHGIAPCAYDTLDDFLAARQ